MDLDIIRKDSWEWHVPDQNVLTPWMPAFLHTVETACAQKGQKTVICRVKDLADAEYLITFCPSFSFADRFKAIFRTKAKREYIAWQILNQEQIPCIEYIGWGKSSCGCALISKFLENTVSAKEYWVRFAGDNPAKKIAFLNELASIARRLLDRKLIHNEFNADNLLCDMETGTIYLTGLYKITHGNHLSRTERKLRLLNACAEFRTHLTHDDVEDFCIKAHLADTTREALALWNEIVVRQELLVRHKWKKRSAAILNGTSKYARLAEETNDTKLFLRNTPWFSPRDLDLNSFPFEEMDHSQAKTIWLDSFLAQMLCKHFPKNPVAWLESQQVHGHDRLYFEHESLPPDRKE